MRPTTELEAIASDPDRVAALYKSIGIVNDLVRDLEDDQLILIAQKMVCGRLLVCGMLMADEAFWKVASNMLINRIGAELVRRVELLNATKAGTNN